MNIVLLQNTLSCEKLDPHTGAGQTTSKPLAGRIMNWISLASTLTLAMFCCSPGGTLDMTHYLLSVNKTFHWCHVGLAWSCAQVLEGTACIVVSQIPSAHPPMPGQPCFCYSLIQPVPGDSLDSTASLRESHGLTEVLNIFYFHVLKAFSFILMFLSCIVQECTRLNYKFNKIKPVYKDTAVAYHYSCLHT